jgi:hypothetical protein
MSIQLKAVNDFCEQGFKVGKIIPLSFEFPSFKISENMFKDAAKEVVNDKVSSAILSGKYGHPALKNITIDDLIEAQIAKSANCASNEQNGKVIFAEQILPKQMMKDDNLDYTEINRKTLNELCVSRLKYSLAHIEASMGAYSDEYSKTIVNKDKFAATMIMLKEMIPTAYKQINLSLKNHPNQALVANLKIMEENPDVSIVKHIADIDKKFAEKYFPKDYKSLVEEEKFAKEFITKPLKFL